MQPKQCILKIDFVFFVSNQVFLFFKLFLFINVKNKYYEQKLNILVKTWLCQNPCS